MDLTAEKTEAMPLRSKAVVRLLLATAAWGLSFPLFKMLFALQETAEPLADSLFLSSHAIALRSLVAGIVLTIFMPRLWRGLTRLEWEQGVALGFFGGLGLICQADGLGHTSASTSAFLTQTYCILLPAWACLRLRQWPSLRIAACIVLVTVGIVLLSGFNLKTFSLGRGETETLVSAIFFAVQILLLEAGRYRANRMMSVSVVMFFGFALCAAPVALVTAPTAAALASIYTHPAAWAIMGIIILVCTLYAYLTMNVWQPHVSATEAGLIYSLEPVAAAFYALFLPAWMSQWCGVVYANEQLTRNLLIGGALITIANILLQFRPKPAEPTV
jgi:drug/metabolite transporter (DMT)-like permease